MMNVTIDGRDIEVAEGTTVLEAAKALGIVIPTLCHDDRLKPFGACRLCIVEIAGMALTTDRADDFSRGRIGMVGMGMTERAARQVYEQSGIGPSDVQVIELHDCFSTNELISYEGLGLCGEGEGEKLVLDDACTHGGRWVVNPSGGLLSKGHPIGATGLAQCAELVWQLRGQAGKRQVEGARAALQHNLGLGGACVVALYTRA